MSKKIFNFKVLDTYTKRGISLYIEINLKRNFDNKINYKSLKLTKNYYVFTSTVTDKYTFSGRLQGFYNDFIFLNDKDKALYEKIMKIENDYHLNDLMSGTKKQIEFLLKNSIYDYANNYKNACKILEDNNLLIDCGYKFGAQWLLKKIDIHTLNEIKKLLLI